MAAAEHPSASSRGLALVVGLRAVVAATVVGLAAGVCAQRADTAAAWLGELTSYAGPWLLIAAAAGILASSRREAATRGAALLLAGVASYYVTFVAAGQGHAPLVAFAWLVAAIVLGPAIGAAGHLACRMPFAAAALAGVLAGEALFVTLERVHPARWSIVAFDALAALAIVTVVPADAGRRRRALVLLAPAAVMGLLIPLCGGLLLRALLP